MDLTPLKTAWSGFFDQLGVYDRRLARAADRQAWLIPYYHRVLDDGEPNPLGLGVSKHCFSEQVAFFRRRFHVCTVRDALRLLESGERLDRPLLSITFDDGYLDNVELALPILERHGCAATFFLCTGPLLDDRPFWWDLVIAMSSKPGTRAWQALSARFGADSVPKPKALEHVLDRLWQLDYEEISGLLNLDDGNPEFDHLCPPRMRPDQAKLLIDHGMEVGAHTHNHQNLTKETEATIRDELAQSRAHLEDWTGEAIDGFAAPHGFFDARVKRIAEEDGFRYIASTDRGANQTLDPFHLTRFGLGTTTLPHIKRTLSQVVV